MLLMVPDAPDLFVGCDRLRDRTWDRDQSVERARARDWLPLKKPNSEVVVNLVKGSNHRMSEFTFVEFKCAPQTKQVRASLYSIINPGPQTPIARKDSSGASGTIRSIRIVPPF